MAWDLTQTGLNNIYAPKWQALTAYTAGDVVQAPDGTIVKRLTSGTSGASYTSANWQSVATVSGTQSNTELATLLSAKADWVTPEQYGAVGDGIVDDTTALKAAATSGKNLRGARGSTYLISDTIILGQNRTYDFNWSTIKATTGMAGKPMVSASNLTWFHLTKAFIDGNSIAQIGVYAYHVNESTSVFDQLDVKNCTADAINFVGSQACILRGLRLNNCARGAYLESCNGLSLRNSMVEYMTGGGIYVCRGTTGYSGGCTIDNVTVQINGGIGIEVVDTTSPVKIINSWLEQNTGDAIKVGGRAVVKNNNISIKGLATPNYAINLASTARGTFTPNWLGAEAGGTGSPNKVRLDNAGLSDDLAGIGINYEPNYFQSNGNISSPLLTTARSLFVFQSNELVYQAVKRIDVSTTASYTAILTAPISSSIEVTISAVENGNGSQGQTIVKTWSSMSNDTRNSFGEVGSTNAFLNGAFYNPVYLAGFGLYVRWTGNNLEIKPESSVSNLWAVEVKMTRLSVNQNVTWLV